MIDTLYNYLFTGALVYLSVLLFPYLFRSIIGPNFFDRILGINSISTIVILMICLVAALQNEQYIIDVALIYAILGFVTVVIVSKAYLRNHKKDREKDFENLKKDYLNNTSIKKEEGNDND